MANRPEQTITVGPARLSYPRLFKPHAKNPGDEPKYSSTVLIPKTDVRSKQLIDIAIEAAKQVGLQDRYQGVIPPVLAIPVYDGDGPKPSDGMPFADECKGHWVFSASDASQPGVLDQNKQPIIRESEIYPGVYAYVSVTFFPYNKNGKKGVGCALNHVMKWQDGEPFAGGISAADAFSAIPVGQVPQVNPYPVAAQPIPVAAPIQQPQVMTSPYPQGVPVQQPQAAPAPFPQFTPGVPAAAPQVPQIDPITGRPYGQ